MDNNFKFVIIGAGVVGLAIAEHLSRYFDNILVIEKENKFGLHTSSRNSEVIHSGFYYPNKSLKAQLCVKGNKMIYEFCSKYNIPHKKCGKLIVANSDIEINELNKIFLLAKDNGVENARILSKQESIDIEPLIRCKKSLLIPSTGILDSHLFMSKLENLAISRDTTILYQLEVKDISIDNNQYSISFSNDDSRIKTKNIINCAGLWSHDLANKIVDKPYNVEYYKGDYFKAPELKGLNHLIYPVPSQLSLGIHTVINLNNEILLGPNAYKVNKIDYSTDDKYKDLFLSQINKLITKKITNINRDYSGIRPKIKFENKMNDFIINQDRKGLFNLVGIDSPGLTSSLAIAEYLYDQVKL